MSSLKYRINSKYKLIRRTSFTQTPVRLCTLADQFAKRSVQIRDPASGEMQRGLSCGGQGEAQFFAVSPNVQSVFAGWSSSNPKAAHIKFWRCEPGSNRADLIDIEPILAGATARRNPTCAEFCVHLGTLITGYDDGAISLATRTGSRLHGYGSAQVHRGGVVAISSSTFDRSFASGGGDGQLALTSFDSGSLTVKTLGKPGARILDVAYSTNRKYVAATREDGTIEIYETAFGKLEKKISTDSICTRIEFFNSNHHLVAGA